MKKLILALGLFAFVAFGVVSVQTTFAATNGVEIAKIDKDPTKDNDKAKKDAKTADLKSKDAKGCCSSAAKTSECSSKASACGDKAKASGCCDKGTKMASANSKENPEKK